MHMYEHSIDQINFYSGEEKLVRVGSDDEEVKELGGRVESFDIADDERLIGCELSESKYNLLRSVTWTKMKVSGF